MANKKIPMRKCVGCQEMKEKKSLIRVVKTAEGDIILAVSYTHLTLPTIA